MEMIRRWRVSTFSVSVQLLADFLPLSAIVDCFGMVGRVWMSGLEVGSVVRRMGEWEVVRTWEEG